MINDARVRPRADDDVAGEPVPDVAGPGGPSRSESPATVGRTGLTPLTVWAGVLGVLLVLLLAGLAYLRVTPRSTSPMGLGDYAGALEGARSGIVDLTSFDYLTLDDNLRQIKAVTTGDLQTESLKALTARRKDITASEAVVNTKVIEGGAGVTKATSKAATVVMVIETTQKTKASTRAQVTRFRIEVQMSKIDGRWLLSGISGR